MIEFSTQHQLHRVNEVLTEYVRLSKRQPDEVLEKKGRDLNIKIFQGFWALRFKSARSHRRKGAVFSGPAFDEAAARGWRVKVRAGLTLSGDYRLARAKTTGGGKGKRSGLNNRALLVAQELAMRQRGGGLLGVSFLQHRWRRGKRTEKGPTGSYLVQNRSGALGLLSSVRKGVTADGAFLTITNQAPGVAIMDRNRSIIRNALAAVRGDTLIYLDRKNRELAEKTLRKIA